jgi:hypothetical protein
MLPERVCGRPHLAGPARLGPVVQPRGVGSGQNSGLFRQI